MADFDPQDIHTEGSDFAPEDIHSEEIKPSEITKLESAGRGAEQGASLGFYDELAGILSAAGRPFGVQNLGGRLSDISTTSPTLDPEEILKAYQQTRDIERAKVQEASAANPMSFMGGALAGGLVTAPAMPTALSAPLGTATKSAPVLEKIARGAVNAIPTAAIGSAGMSEADLTKGQVGEFGKDVAVGTGIGAGLGAAIPAVTSGISSIASGISKSKPIQELVDAYKAGRQNLNLSSPQFLKESRDKLKEIAGNVETSIENKTQDLFKQKRQILNNLEEQGIKAETKDDEVKMLGKTINKMMEKDSQKSPQELENMLRELKDLKANVTTPSGMSAVDKAVKQVQAIQDNMSPEIGKINNQLFQTIDAGEALLKENVLDYANASKELLGKEKLANLFENSSKYKTESFLDDIINRGLETSKGVKVSPLKELAPDVAESISSTKPIVRNMELAKEAQRPVFSQGSDFLSTIAKGVEKGSTTLANKAGLAAEANKQVLQNGIKSLSDASPEVLNTAVSKLAKLGQEGAQFAKVLSDAVSKNKQSKNAIIFGLMQQPKFRELFKQINEEEK